MTYETAPGLSPLRLGIGDKVRLVFIDDSQQSEPPRPGLGHLLALGAVIVRDEQIAPYATTLAAIRTELGIPPGEEIKWKPPATASSPRRAGNLALSCVPECSRQP